MKKRQIILFSTIAVFGAVLLAVVVATARVYQRSKEADRLISALRDIRLGSSTAADCAVLLSPFRALAAESEADGNVREVTYIFYNTEMQRLKLAPYADLQVVLTLQNGVAARKSMSLYVERGYAGAVQEEVWRGQAGYDGSVGNHDPERPDRLVQGYKNDLGKYARLEIRDDNRLVPEQLRTDWMVNVQCLYKLGGCQDARQIIPSLGHDPIADQWQTVSSARRHASYGL